MLSSFFLSFIKTNLRDVFKSASKNYKKKSVFVAKITNYPKTPCPFQIFGMITNLCNW